MHLVRLALSPPSRRPGTVTCCFVAWSLRAPLGCDATSPAPTAGCALRLRGPAGRTNLFTQQAHFCPLSVHAVAVPLIAIKYPSAASANHLVELVTMTPSSSTTKPTLFTALVKARRAHSNTVLAE
jgi:hypothetical protein